MPEPPHPPFESDYDKRKRLRDVLRGQAIKRRKEQQDDAARRGEHNFTVTPPAPSEEHRRLVIAVTNDDAGNEFLESLRENQESLGFFFAGTLAELLRAARVERSTGADELRDKFAFLEIRPGWDFPVMNGVLRHGCRLSRGAQRTVDVDVEADFPMRFSSSVGLGPNYNLRSHGSLHDRYLQLLNLPAYRSAKSAKIAVVDSGFEKPGSLSGFLDLVDPSNSTEKDTFGHGTAMASIIADVALGADVYSVRASDQGPHVSEAMLGVAAASFHFAADIINLSFGMPYAQSCTACGSASGVSKVFFRLLRALSEKPMSSGEPPILVAATGNDGLSTGFDAPALWDFTLAVGSINKKTERSTFSNYGSSGQTQYVMMPGGEESQGTISEWIGQAKQKCFGTSPAAAYASGMLALYLAHPNYKGLDRATFLATVLGQCKPCRGQNRSEHGHGYLTFN
jgi:Subtilase family